MAKKVDSIKKSKLPLSKTHSKLANEAFGWDPDLITFGSQKKLSWKCKRGHLWDAKPAKRTSRGDGCPICSGKKILKGFNDLRTTHPKIAKQAYKWDPATVSPGSNKKLRWICSKKHVWTTAVMHRTSSNATGCPVCSGRKIVPGINDLQTLFPKVAAEALGWSPAEISPGSNKKYRWKCSKGHEWSAIVISRTKLRTGCPVCSNLKIVPGINDLKTLMPDIAKESYGWNPSKVGIGTDLEKDWKCKLGHIYRARINKRTKRNQGCPVCANKKIVVGFNDLATTHPELANEAYGWDPTKMNAGRGSKKSDEKLKWKCTLGHIYEATPVSRTNKLIQSGCPYCSGNSNLKGFNDLATLHPEIAKEAYGWDPTLSRGNHKKIHSWMCPLGHIYKSSITERLTSKGCQYCLGRKVLVGFNDLATVNSDLAAQADGWDPKTVTAGTQKLKLWRCELGHKWKSSVGNRSAGKGCPSCSQSGFNPNEPAWIYFGVHESLDLLQIGISNKVEERLNYHKRFDWNIQDIYGPIDGLLAQEWETSILRMLRKNGAIMGPRKDKIYNRGSDKKDVRYVGTEMWTKSTFPVKSIKELMRLTEKWEDED
jgi:hypothetical protein